MSPYTVVNVGGRAYTRPRGSVGGLTDMMPGTKLCEESELLWAHGSADCPTIQPRSELQKARKWVRSWEKENSTLLLPWLSDLGQVPSYPHLLPQENSSPCCTQRWTGWFWRILHVLKQPWVLVKGFLWWKQLMLGVYNEVGWAKSIILPPNFPWLMTFPPRALTVRVVLLDFAIARKGTQPLQMLVKSIIYVEGKQVMK